MVSPLSLVLTANMPYLDVAERLINDLLEAYTSDRTTQHEQGTAHAAPIPSESLQMIQLCQDLLHDIEELRSRIIDVHFPSPTPSNTAIATEDSSVARDGNDEEPISNSPWEGPIITETIDIACKIIMLEAAPDSISPIAQALNPAQDLSFLRTVHYYINLTTALLQPAPNPEPVPKDIPDMARSSLVVNKCLETLRYLEKVDLDRIYSVSQSWSRWRSDRVGFLNYVAEIMQKTRASPVALSYEDQVLAHIGKIAVVAGIPAVSLEVLTRLEHASEQRDWSGMFLENKMLRKIRDSIRKSDAMASLPWSRFAGTCEFCSRISLRAMNGNPWHRAKTCVRMLRCAQSTYENKTHHVMAPEYMCALGAFLFENSTVEMSPIHFIRLEQPSTTSGCLELGLSKNSEDWDGLTKILNTTGFENCENSTISFDVAATPSMFH